MENQLTEIRNITQKILNNQITMLKFIATNVVQTPPSNALENYMSATNVVRPQPSKALENYRSATNVVRLPPSKALENFITTKPYQVIINFYQLNVRVLNPISFFEFGSLTVFLFHVDRIYQMNLKN